MSHEGKKFTWNNAADESFQRKKKNCVKLLCIGGRELWHIPSRTGMEREDCLETDRLRKQSHERHGNEVRGTQSGDVCGGHLCGKLEGISGQ